MASTFLAASLLEMHTNMADIMTPPMKQLTQMSTKAQTGSVLSEVAVGEFELRTQIVPAAVPNTICTSESYAIIEISAA